MTALRQRLFRLWKLLAVLWLAFVFVLFLVNQGNITGPIPFAVVADVFASRISVARGFPSVEIVPLFAEVAAEAERLLKVSSSIQKPDL